MASLATSGNGLRLARFRQLREGTIPPGLSVLVVPLLLGVAAIPLFVTPFPPLADYPGHLAITYILENYNRITPFQAAYILDHGIYPNLAMDILVPPLAGIFGIERSGLIFIFFIFVVTVCGALLVNKALYGRVSIGALFRILYIVQRDIGLGFYELFVRFGNGDACLWRVPASSEVQRTIPNHCFITAEHGCFCLSFVCICHIRYFSSLL